MPILTAKQGHNVDLFTDILDLYVPEGSRVLDMTWGRGNFWAETESREVIGIDIATPKDCLADLRYTPFSDSVFDAVVLDPPYARRVGTSIKSSIAEPYGLAAAEAPIGWEATRKLYRDGAKEALRLLRDGGVLILKCQDEIESGKQRWNHVALLEIEGYICEDLFVLVQKGVPAMRVPYQLHARKNHSYFIIQRKK